MHGRKPNRSRSSEGVRSPAEEGRFGGFREDLADGRAMVWQLDSSWSRSDVAKACVAACVSMTPQRGIKTVVMEWRTMVAGGRVSVWAKSRGKCGSFIAPTSSNFKPQDNEAASPVLDEFWIGSFLAFFASFKAVPRHCPPPMRGWDKPRFCQPLVGRLLKMGGPWQ